jgi:hypothetical protein
VFEHFPHGTFYLPDTPSIRLYLEGDELPPIRGMGAGGFDGSGGLGGAGKGGAGMSAGVGGGGSGGVGAAAGGYGGMGMGGQQDSIQLASSYAHAQNEIKELKAKLDAVRSHKHIFSQYFFIPRK